MLKNRLLDQWPTQELRDRRKNMKRRYIKPLLLLIPLLLGSCTPPLWFIDNDDGGDYGERQQLNFYHLWQRGATGYTDINNLIKEFNASDVAKKYNVYVKGNGVNFWDYWDKVNLAISGGTAPDIFLHTVSDVALRSRYDLDLTEMYQEDVKEGIDTIDANEMFFDTQINDISKYNKDKHMTAWPFSATVRVVYYNKTMFDAAGITSLPTTWSEIEEVSKKLTTYNEDGNPSSGYKTVGWDPFTGEGQYIHEWGWLSGHSFWSEDEDGRPVPHFNDSEFIKNLTYLYEDSYVRRDKQARDNLEQFMSDVGKTGADPFVSGKLGMVVGNEGLVTKLREANVDFEYGVFEMPTLNSSIETTNWSSSYSIELYDNSHRNISDETARQRNRGAWEFLKFLYTEDSQKVVSSTGFLIACKKYYSSTVDTNPIMKEISQAVEHTREAEYYDAIPKWTSDIQVYVNSVASYKMTAEEAMNQSQSLMESKIKQYYQTQVNGD